MQGRMRRRGFTLIEILVSIGIIMILVGFVLATVEKVRHRAYIADCASNLRQIGAAITSYCNENHGNFPRTRYVPGSAVTMGTGSNAPDPFAAPPVGPSPNDVTAPWFLLMRAARLPPAIMLCPYNDVNEFQAEKANLFTHGNFTDYKKNLGYSFANPYPDSVAEAAGYHLTGKTSAQFAVAADLNPGYKAPGNRQNANAAVPGASWSQIKISNSENHEQDGENVLYGDGHVDWCKNPLAGIAGDNIFTNKKGQIEASPTDKNDSVLLPAEN